MHCRLSQNARARRQWKFPGSAFSRRPIESLLACFPSHVIFLVEELAAGQEGKGTECNHVDLRGLVCRMALTRHLVVHQKGYLYLWKVSLLHEDELR